MSLNLPINSYGYVCTCLAHFLFFPNRVQANSGWCAMFLKFFVVWRKCLLILVKDLKNIAIFFQATSSYLWDWKLNHSARQVSPVWNCCFFLTVNLPLPRLDVSNFQFLQLVGLNEANPESLFCLFHNHNYNQHYVVGDRISWHLMIFSSTRDLLWVQGKMQDSKKDQGPV